MLELIKDEFQNKFGAELKKRDFFFFSKCGFLKRCRDSQRAFKIKEKICIIISLGTTVNTEKEQCPSAEL